MCVCPQVTDAKDRRTLMVLLSRFYNEEVVLGGADLAPGAATLHSGGNTSSGSEASEYVCPEPGAWVTHTHTDAQTHTHSLSSWWHVHAYPLIFLDVGGAIVHVRACVCMCVCVCHR